MDAGEDSWLRVRQWTGGQVGDRTLAAGDVKIGRGIWLGILALQGLKR